MPFKFHDARRHHIPKAKYRVRNWPAYNAGLCRRGSITFWLSPDVTDGWKAPKREGRGGERRRCFMDRNLSICGTQR